MKSFFRFVIWIFVGRLWTNADHCHQVPGICKENIRNVPQCLEKRMKRCNRIIPRLPTPNYYYTRLSGTSKKTYDTEKGYAVDISLEAIRMSTNENVPSNETEADLTLIVLNKTFFRTGNDSNDPIGGLHEESVLGVWLGVKQIHNLSEPIQLWFRKSNLTKNGTCVHWNLDEENSGHWSTNGCTTIIKERDFVCSCTHLSFFAVLLSPDIPEVSQIISLNYVSYIGSVCTIIFTAVVVVMILCQRKKQKEQSFVIHMQLTSSLFLLHLSFLCSAWLTGQTALYQGICQGLGLALHWSLLATYTWTAIEGFHLYLLLVRVFNIYINRYLLKLSLVGWGLPTIIVIICGFANVYGKYTLEESSTTNLCWITVRTVNLITVNGYLGLVLLFNAAMLAVMVVKLKQLRSRSQSINTVNQVWKDWASFLGLCCVLGLPWGMAFFTHGPLSLSSLYIFSILNCFQGVFIFLWLLIITCKPRKEKQISSKGTTVIFHSEEGKL